MSFFKNKLLLVEIFAVICSALYTILITYGNSWCWLFAISASVVFLYLCYQKKLIAETILHGFYFLTGIYGWYTWGNSSSFVSSSLNVETNLLLLGMSVLGVFLMASALKRFSDAKLPYIDSFTTIFSFIGTFLMIYMYKENWYYWIVIDAVSIYLYAKRGLYISAVLYLFYTGLAINGLMNW